VREEMWHSAGVLLVPPYCMSAERALPYELLRSMAVTRNAGRGGEVGKGASRAVRATETVGNNPVRYARATNTRRWTRGQQPAGQTTRHGRQPARPCPPARGRTDAGPWCEHFQKLAPRSLHSCYAVRTALPPPGRLLSLRSLWACIMPRALPPLLLLAGSPLHSRTRDASTAHASRPEQRDAASTCTDARLACASTAPGQCLTQATVHSMRKSRRPHTPRRLRRAPAPPPPCPGRTPPPHAEASAAPPTAYDAPRRRRRAHRDRCGIHSRWHGTHTPYTSQRAQQTLHHPPALSSGRLPPLAGFPRMFSSRCSQRSLWTLSLTCSWGPLSSEFLSAETAKRTISRN